MNTTTCIEPVESILVVSPDDAVCGRLAHILTNNGYGPVVCTTEAQARDAMYEHYIGLAFIDCDAHGEGSEPLALAREMKNANPALVIALVGSRTDYHEAVEAMRLGASDFLHKPFDDNEPCRVLQRYHEMAALHRRTYEAQQLYVHLIQNLPLVVFTLTESGQVAFINAACRRILGFHPGEATRKPDWFLSRVLEADRDELATRLADAMHCGDPISHECRMVHKRGQIIHVIVQTMPCFADCDAEGKPHRGPAQLDGIIIDITDRVVLEQALLQDEKVRTLGAIAAEVAHEIRNPLVSIGGFARRLAARSGECRELDIITTEATRLETLLSRITSYLKPVSMSPQPVDVGETLRECTTLLRDEFSRHSVTPALSISDDLPHIEADSDILAQILINVLIGTLRIAAPHSHLHLRAYAKNGGSSALQVQVAFSLQSNVRLNPARMFLPFEEGGESTSLPLSYRLLKSLGGVLAFQHAGPTGDEGIFTLTLPRQLATADIFITEGHHPAPRPASEPLSLSMHSARGFEQLLTREWEKAAAEHTPLAVLLLDVDHFEAYARSYGQKSASQALGLIAGALLESLTGPADQLAEYGGQQFAILLPDTGSVGAQLVASEILEAVNRLAIAHESSSTAPHLTVSIGCSAILPGHDTTITSTHTLLKHALRNVFQAKKNGRDTTVCG